MRSSPACSTAPHSEKPTPSPPISSVAGAGWARSASWTSARSDEPPRVSMRKTPLLMTSRCSPTRRSTSSPRGVTTRSSTWAVVHRDGSRPAARRRVARQPARARRPPQRRCATNSSGADSASVVPTSSPSSRVPALSPLRQASVVTAPVNSSGGRTAADASARDGQPAPRRGSRARRRRPTPGRTSRRPPGRQRRQGPAPARRAPRRRPGEPVVRAPGQHDREPRAAGRGARRPGWLGRCAAGPGCAGPPGLRRRRPDGRPPARWRASRVGRGAHRATVVAAEPRGPAGHAGAATAASAAPGRRRLPARAARRHPSGRGTVSTG